MGHGSMGHVRSLCCVALILEVMCIKFMNFPNLLFVTLSCGDQPETLVRQAKFRLSLRHLPVASSQDTVSAAVTSIVTRRAVSLCPLLVRDCSKMRRRLVVVPAWQRQVLLQTERNTAFENSTFH